MKAETVTIDLSVLLEIKQRAETAKAWLYFPTANSNVGCAFSEVLKIIEAVNEAIREQSNG